MQCTLKVYSKGVQIRFYRTRQLVDKLAETQSWTVILPDFIGEVKVMIMMMMMIMMIMMSLMTVMM